MAYIAYLSAVWLAKNPALAILLFVSIFVFAVVAYAGVATWREEICPSRPRAEIIPVFERGNVYIAVRNQGIAGNFTASIRPLDATSFPRGLPSEYHGRWEHARGSESRIIHGESDRVKLAQVRHSLDPVAFNLQLAVGDRSDCDSTSWSPVSKQKLRKPYVVLMATVNSDPVMAGKSASKILVIDVDGIKEMGHFRNWRPHNGRKFL